ncbi:MAG: class I SAM-dependent methyltransferase [Anaerolineaceae bacterium]|nr:class I SAM-dependent methyltransferase [Anaerolineaceae bacterium]MDE0327788.1 class I SAM-dependent methyltransferase [Anaerolineaceae bacterium]
MSASDSQSLARQRFGRFAAAYVTSVNHASGPDLARLLTMAQPEPHWRALDIATGGGHTALTFAPFVASVVASDLTPAMLEQAEAHIGGLGIHNVSYREAAADDLPFDDDSFELVTCRIAAHHFPDVPRFFQESARVLRPGGLLLLQDQALPVHRPSATWVDDFERRRDPSHHRAYSETGWRAFFDSAGLQVEGGAPVVKRHNLQGWARRQGNDEAAIARLDALLREAPAPAALWCAPRDLGGADASFLIRQVQLAGRKP